MTAEEIDIIVQAHVDEALKEFEKLLPAIRKQVKAISKAFAEAFNDIDVSKLQETVDEAVKLINKKMASVKKTAEDSIQLKVNNKEASKAIKQTQKELESLQKQTTADENLNIHYGSEGRKRTISGYTTLSSGEIEENAKRTITGYTTLMSQASEETSNTFREKFQSAIDYIGEKIKDIPNWLSETNERFKNAKIADSMNDVDDDPFDLGETENKLRLINTQIADLEGVINGFKQGKIELGDEELAQIEVKLDELYAKLEELENGSSSGGFFANLSTIIQKAASKLKTATKLTSNWKNSFNQVGKASINVVNNIKSIGAKMKSGLKQVIKYAGALFSLRSIYSLLSSSANSWLSSQNAQAQQLSANIDYMKYAMRKCVCTSNRICC